MCRYSTLVSPQFPLACHSERSEESFCTIQERFFGRKLPQNDKMGMGLYCNIIGIHYAPIVVILSEAKNLFPSRCRLILSI